MLLSAALIVKNEERFLGDCLASICDVVDEIVVVDTGSTDDTRAIALEHGARLFEFVWTHDFAAARNHALDQTQGRWILYIDADERILPETAATLRHQLEETDHCAYFVSLHPRQGFTAYPELRLFVNHPLIRFHGRIHENIWPGINRYLHAIGGNIGSSDVILDHVGYEGDQQHKHQRNLPLLREALKADPSRVFSWCHLASIYLALGRRRLAKKAWTRALALVRKKRGWLLAEDALPFIGLIQLGMHEGRGIRGLLEEALAAFPDNLHLLWLQGEELMAAKDYAGAAQVFETHLARAESGAYDLAMAYDNRMLGVIPLALLATCHFKLGHYAESRDYFQRAAEAEPANMEYRLKQALCSQLLETASL